MSEKTTANENYVNNVQGQLQLLQQRIAAVETEIQDGESGRLLYYTMGGCNE